MRNGHIHHGNKSTFSWDNPQSAEAVMADVSDQLGRNISLAVPESDDAKIDGKLIISFPFQKPHQLVTSALLRAFENNANNIGTRLHNGNGSEGGFDGSQELERRVLRMIAEVLGATPGMVDGFMTSGATTANLAGLLIGREKGRTREQQCKNTTAIFGSFLTHYSIDRSAKIIGIAPNTEDTVNDDGTGYYKLGTDERGHVLVEQIEESIERVIDQHPNVTHFIVVGTVGTTMLGSVDDIPQMNDLLAKLKLKFPEKRFHFHVDAAFGAFVAPFIEGVPDIGFRNRHVDSIAVDPYKTLPGHVGSGALLVRKEQADAAKSSSAYVPGEAIGIEGSRPGAMAAACYAMLRLLGKKGLQENAQRLMGIASKARDELAQLHLNLFSNDLPIIAVKGRFPPQLLDWYIIHEQHNFPHKVSRPLAPDCGQMSIWNVVAMPHIERNIEELAYDYRWILAGTRCLWDLE